jgi:hypothetical protein
MIRDMQIVRYKKCFGYYYALPQMLLLCRLAATLKQPPQASKQ